ncbi:L,D-transpeptidase family protein [Jiella sp. M17.18]|uniref:L,D-transpeptidase family protein n=1 Tax=Jiella sp. M17.18 TaxID=3234247 RepID=UPI0034DF9809
MMKTPLAGLILGMLMLPAPLASAQTAPASGDAPVRLAQYIDRSGAPDGAVEVFTDGYGQRVYLDSFGRVVGVERSRRQEFQDRRQRFRERRGRIIDGPPPPGVTVEGPAYLDSRGAPGDANTGDMPPPRSADPFGDYNGPVEAAPLPAAPSAGRSQEAELPGRPSSAQPPSLRQSAVEPPSGPSTPAGGDLPPAGADAALPAPGAPIVQSDEGRDIKESNPAPTVSLAKGKNAKAEVAALQILLDREGMSPGVIDGRMGGNVNKAVAAYREKFGKDLPTGNPQALADDLDATGGPPIVQYEITSADVAGPYVASIPSDYGEKAQLPAMSYERVSEKLAEKFHMDEDYLKAINPGADFNKAGTLIKVANVGPDVTGEVARIIADKGREQVRAYDASGTLLAAYPATIGSTETPSPSGTVQVSRIAFNPSYTYNPKINFKQGSNDKILTIPPGPNGPVGSIWIALSKPTYGIHGTPEPSKIGKTNSHGCVRLTNWDATELAKMVKAGVTVEFTE